MAVSTAFILADADAFRRSYPDWPHPAPMTTTDPASQGGTMTDPTPRPPTAQAISRLLKAAGFTRSELLSRASLRQRRTAGFYVRGTAGEVCASWRQETSLLTPSAAQRDRDKATALEMAGKYAEAIRAAGWTAEVIHLAGPLVRVGPKPEAQAGTTPAIARHDHSWAEDMGEVRACCPDHNPLLAGTGIRCPGDPAAQCEAGTLPAGEERAG